MKQRKFLLSLFVGVLALLSFASCDKEENELPRISVNPEEYVVTADGATLGFNVTANREWKASITPESASEWLQLSATTGSGDASLSMVAAPNDGYDYRHAVVVFTIADGGKTEATTMHVVQNFHLEIN